MAAPSKTQKKTSQIALNISEVDSSSTPRIYFNKFSVQKVGDVAQLRVAFDDDAFERVAYAFVLDKEGLRNVRVSAENYLRDLNLEPSTSVSSHIPRSNPPLFVNHLKFAHAGPTGEITLMLVPINDIAAASKAADSKKTVPSYVVAVLHSDYHTHSHLVLELTSLFSE